jgi:hypothetical protein
MYADSQNIDPIPIWVFELGDQGWIHIKFRAPMIDGGQKTFERTYNLGIDRAKALLSFSEEECRRLSDSINYDGVHGGGIPFLFSVDTIAFEGAHLKDWQRDASIIVYGCPSAPQQKKLRERIEEVLHIDSQLDQWLHFIHYNNWP